MPRVRVRCFAPVVLEIPTTMSRLFRTAALAAASCAPAFAQTPAPAGTPASLDPVVITATRTERPGLDVPASVEVIERDTLRDAQLRVNLSETLGRVPGLVILDRQNYAQDLQLSIRGFGSRSTFGVRGVRLYVDGVPATFPDGQGQVSHFPLNAAERIEVLRGPFSALYGNSSGGVVALTTQLAPQPLRFEPSLAAGANGTWRAGLNGVGGDKPHAFAVDAGRFKTDGARDHSAARRDTVSIRTAFLDSPLGRARISLNALDMPDSQDPLGLTRAQLNQNPDQASPVALQFNTRKSTRQSTLGGDLSTTLGATTLTTTAWLGSRDVIQFQSIPVATQASPNHPGGVIDFDRYFGGADVRAALPLGPTTTTFGLQYERLNEARRGYQNFIGTTLGVIGAIRRQESNRIEAIDPYVQTEWPFADRWTAQAGVRSTQVRFESRDAYIVGVNGDDSGSKSFSGVNPTVGIVFRPARAWSLYASYGRGFETPTLNELAYRPDGSAGFNTALEAARSDNFEFGVKTLLADSVRLNAAVFTTTTRDDIVVRTNVGGRSAFGNVARTRRDGVEIAADWRGSGPLSLYASAALIDARFDTGFLTCGAPPCTTPTLPVASGNDLPGVPQQTAFAEAKYRAAWADLTLSWRAQSSIAVDDRNTDRAGGYGVLAFAVARSFQAGATPLRAFARVDNLTDRRYVGSVIVNEGNARFFEPAPGRTWLIGIEAEL
jgi:iron complex outermembrane receptor protein